MLHLRTVNRVYNFRHFVFISDW